MDDSSLKVYLKHLTSSTVVGQNTWLVSLASVGFVGFFAEGVSPLIVSKLAALTIFLGIPLVNAALAYRRDPTSRSSGYSESNNTPTPGLTYPVGTRSPLYKWRSLIAAFITVFFIMVVTFLLVTWFFPGETFLAKLGTTYRVLWDNATQREFTFIMRENPWLLVIPGGAIIIGAGLNLPLVYWGRAGYIYMVFGIGFLGGHVFW